MSDFSHVASKLVRRVLKADPVDISPRRVRKAVIITLNAAKVYNCDDSIHPAIQAVREKAALKAADRLLEGRRSACHRALKQFWRI
jgi:hypothetical protein